MTSHAGGRTITWILGGLDQANDLLREHHYLGPIKSGGAKTVVIGSADGKIVAAQVWRGPTSRRLPSDGSWLELSRWCLTPEAGKDAGSRMHAAAVRLVRAAGGVTTFVSYSDPSQGHTGALYRACNWRWSPTWHRLRPPPTGQGNWGGKAVQHVKDRWIFPLTGDRRRDALLAVNDAGAIRKWLATAGRRERDLAARSMALDLVAAVTGADDD